MKNLRSALKGTRFDYARDHFVVLEHLSSGILAIREHNWTKVPFDDNINDLRNASARKILLEYWQLLRNGGANLNTVRKMAVNLSATDGTMEYHMLVDTPVGLLTLAQYGRYQDIIPDVENPWWLATPVQTPLQKGGNALDVWCAGPKGGILRQRCVSPACIRPILLFDPDLECTQAA